MDPAAPIDPDRLRADIVDVEARLRAAGCVAAEEEASILVAEAADAGTLEEWVARRERGEPLAWITGTTHFAGATLRVAPGVYVPRPQTEELARRAAALLPPGGRAADLCTGTGAIAAHLLAAVPGARVVGVDDDPVAVACARDNGVPAVVGDLGSALAPGMFDVVTAVAPYVPSDEMALLPSDVRAYEPWRALDGGADGLDLLRRLVLDDAAWLLRPGGWLLVEAGGEQDRELAPALAAHGFEPATTWRDAEGDLRGLAARHN